MRPSLLLLLLLLLFLSLGSSTTFVGCGSGDVNGFATFGCSTGDSDDPCDFIVTLLVTVLQEADGSPVQDATVYVDTGPSDSINTKLTDTAGQALWADTAFITGFSARCGGQDIGTVEPYDKNTRFTFDILVSAPSYAMSGTSFTVSRGSRDISIAVRLSPL
jgi:hypothetical protein